MIYQYIIKNAFHGLPFFSWWVPSGWELIVILVVLAIIIMILMIYINRIVMIIVLIVIKR